MLTFKLITIDNLEEIAPYAKRQPTRSCDYTPGNLIMWSRFMNYKFAIAEETLFISCKSEQDLSSEAFLPPIGALPLSQSLRLLKSHCNENNLQLRLTAVPEPLLKELKGILPEHNCTPLSNWSDYIYSAQSLATLQGRALNKKRNRYNKFITEYPEHKYTRCTPEDIKEIIQFLGSERDCQNHRDDNMRCYEQWQCMATVRNLERFPQPAGMIKTDGKIIAFTLGEVIGDTLYIHIEKASREYAGAGEAINRYFASDITEDNPSVTHINREEDLGDKGLQQAKKAYNPTEMLHRYEFSMP